MGEDNVQVGGVDIGRQFGESAVIKARIVKTCHGYAVCKGDCFIFQESNSRIGDAAVQLLLFVIIEPHFVVACDVVTWGYLCRALTKFYRRIEIGVAAVGDVARYHDNVGALCGDLFKQAAVVTAENCIVKVGYLHYAKTVRRRGDFRACIGIFAHLKPIVLKPAKNAQQKYHYYKNDDFLFGEFRFSYYLQDSHLTAWARKCAVLQNRNGLRS